MTKQDKSTCCGKCEKAEMGACSKLDKMLAALKPPSKETQRAV